MKRLATILALATGLITGPAIAGHETGHNILNKENVGGALGATLGAVVGSQFGDGKGQLATTAVGAVGGYVVGRNVAHNYQGGYQGGGYQRGGHQRGRYKSDRHRSSKRSHYRKDERRYESRARHKPRIRPVRELYVAKTTSNVRSGPSTRFRVVDQLRDHERVRVVGKVQGRNWYMVRARHGRGFVYAPLLRPAHGGYGHYERDDRHNQRGYRGNRWRP